MKLRRLNPAGVERFTSYHAQLRDERSLPPPMWLLEDGESSEAVADATIENRSFANRLEVAQYLDSVFSQSGLTRVESDAGLWTWLTLFYFDQVCPMKKGKGREVAVLASYVPNLAAQRRIYRHLLLGPWQMFRAHRDNPDRLRGLLSSAPDVATSETYRLFIENSSLIACKSAVAVASLLYFDPDTGKLKRRSGNKDNGGCRRLIDFLKQLDCTYDLQQIPEQALLAMLPREFKQFIPAQKLLNLA